MTAPRLTWRQLPHSFRTLGAWMTVVQLIGYTTALGYIWWTTRMVPAGIAARYRGGEPEAASATMQFGKSLPEMLGLTHTHLLSMSVIFVMSGGALALWHGLEE